jgi:RNA polymerase II elongation factor ELL
MADHRVALVGAPDANPQAKTRCVQAMQLNLTNDVVEELLDCIKSGKCPQVLFGSTPVCAYAAVSCI